jgi:hypothetical protein
MRNYLSFFIEEHKILLNIIRHQKIDFVTRNLLNIP